jgi:hypothetical protein
MTAHGKYTCTQYRQEMMLLGLKRRQEDPGLPEAEKIRLAEEIRQLERLMEMD